MNHVTKLAFAIETMLAERILTRSLVRELVQELVVSNPSLFGAWVIMEPNTLGDDAPWASTPGHDKAGRLRCAVARKSAGGVAHFTMGGTSESEWYRIPSKAGTPCIAEAYPLRIDDGPPVWVTTELCPINIHGAVNGVAGVYKLAPPRDKPPTRPVVRVFRQGATSAAPSLSPREKTIMQLLNTGHPNKGIAELLVISPHTVKNHIDNIYQKLGATNRLAAIKAASDAGLI